MCLKPILMHYSSEGVCNSLKQRLGIGQYYRYNSRDSRLTTTKSLLWRKRNSDRSMNARLHVDSRTVMAIQLEEI